MTVTSPSLPLVAIVTPVHNGEEFLAETMESVQRQSYSNVVHVLLDNASTDRTPDIVATFKNRKVPLVVGHNDTLLTMTDNWNRALTLIPGGATYFMVLSADDVLLPDAIARMVEIAETDAAIMAVTGVVNTNGETRDFGWPKDRSVYDGAEVIQHLFRRTPIMDARIVMFRRRALDLRTPFFDPALRTAEDIEAVLLSVITGKLGFVHEPIAKIREHENNASNTIVRPMGLQFLDHFVVIDRYAPNQPAIYRDYRRYYLRRLLIWRWSNRTRQTYDYHMRKLADLGERPRLLDYIDAAMDMVLKRARLRPDNYVFPG